LTIEYGLKLRNRKEEIEMTKEITLRCKNCGKPFGYSEEAYQLMAEKGESKIERCEECRKEHGKRIRGIKAPYFPFREVVPSAEFTLFPPRHTSHGKRALRQEEKKREDWDFSITDEEILTLYQKLEENQVVIVASPTGTGKSIFIPKRLIEAPESYSGDFVNRLIRQGQIIITQPRILATESVPRKQAQISGSSVGPGHLIGFRHSEEDLSDRWNRVITITDGTLPNWIREGKLDQYSLIIVDEAHERSCNIDLILGFFRRELLKYPQLRLIISSATINAQKFLDAFREMKISAELFDLSFLAEKKKHKGYIHFWKDDSAYVLSPKGVLEKTSNCNCWFCQKLAEEKRKFWEGQKDDVREQELPEVITNLVSKILGETKEGDILVFLHGQRAIDDTVRIIRAKHSERLVEVIPAYRKVQEKVEERLAQKTNKRRVIVGTNLLETSLTFKGAVYGIDSGYIKEAKWDPDTQISTLPTERHSRDGRKQRWGRLGRIEDGYVYNLYTRGEFEKAEEHTLPEITRSCLEDSLVSLKGAGITETEQFPWMEKSSDHPQMKGEIERSHQSLKERGVVDRKGEIVEKALELMGIPRSSNEASFLFSADEEGCLFEAMTTLWLMSTREGEVRTGVNLYSSGLGLLLWEQDREAKTKMKVWALHQGLRVGCRDDLDFAIKLAYCFRKAEAEDKAKEWTEYHFVNHENLQKILSEIDKLIAERLGEEREESVREIDITQLDKIRSLMATAWPEKIVNLKQGEPTTYPVAGKTKVGVVSPLCVGNWQGKKKAVVASAIEGEAVIEGYPRRVPVASFMVQLPGQREGENLFVDGRLPVGNWVQIEEKKPFDRDFRIGDTLEVKIEQVKRDPVGKGGWIVGRTKENFEIPVELREMSLSPWGPGLEWIEGQTLSLTVKDLDAGGFPQLSNIKKVIEDLSAIRKEISEKNTFPGYVVEINEEEENATAVIQREDGIIHPFEIYKDFVPGKEISNLRIGEEVIVGLSLPKTEKDHIQADRLTKEETDNIHVLTNGEYDRNKGEVFFPYCLENNDFNNWLAKTETIDFVKRHSWQYCLIAGIEALKERLSQLKEMDEVEGIITQIDYEEDGKTIKSAQVVVKGNIPGFAFGSDLGSLSVSEGDRIQFCVKAVDPNSGYLKLVSKHSEDEKKKKHEEFIKRTQANIRRWEGNIRKARQNIAKNQVELRTARTKNYEDTVKSWIAEDERKIRDWLYKIDDARSKLR